MTENMAHFILILWNGLIQVKEEGRAGFSVGWQGCSKGFPKEEPCQPEENPVLPNSFT